MSQDNPGIGLDLGVRWVDRTVRTTPRLEHLLEPDPDVLELQRRDRESGPPLKHCDAEVDQLFKEVFIKFERSAMASSI